MFRHRKLRLHHIVALGTDPLAIAVLLKQAITLVARVNFDLGTALKNFFLFYFQPLKISRKVFLEPNSNLLVQVIRQ